jgi:hypothetical protein
MAHLASCESCEARWHAEIALTGQFRAMRAQAMASSGASQVRRDLRAATLMKQMSLRKEPLPIRASRITSMGWVLSAAAALLLAIGIGYGLGRRRAAQAVQRDMVYEAGLGDAGSNGAGDDFIALPYALPPVPGEMVSIVHSDFAAATLANLGIEVDPAWQSDDSDTISADVVVGQDGFPRAVRITESVADSDDVVQF